MYGHVFFFSLEQHAIGSLRLYWRPELWSRVSRVHCTSMLVMCRCHRICPVNGAADHLQHLYT